MRPHTGLLILVGVCLFLLLLSSFSSSFSIVVGYCSSTVCRKSERIFM